MNVDSFIRLSELFEHRSVDRKAALEYFYSNDTKLFYWADSTHKECKENIGKLCCYRATFEGHGYIQIDRDDSSLALIRKEKSIRANATPFVLEPESLDTTQFSYEFRLKKQRKFILRVSKQKNEEKVTLDVERFEPIEVEVEKLKEALNLPESEDSHEEARKKIRPGTETYFHDYVAFAVELLRDRIQSLRLSVDTDVDDLFVRREDAEKIHAQTKSNVMPISEETRVDKLQEIISAFMFLLVKSQILLGEPLKGQTKNGDEFNYYPTHNECVRLIKNLKIGYGKGESRFSKEGFAKSVLQEIKRDSHSHPNLDFKPNALGFETFVDYLNEFMADKTDSWPQDEKIPKWVRNSK